MQKIIATSAVWLVMLSATAAPASAQNREHQQQSAMLQMLQEQTQQLSLALAQMTEALKAVNARLDTSEQFQQRRFADQEVLVKTLGSDLSAIRERTQDTDRRLRSLSDEIDALRTTFLSLPALISQAQLAAAPVDPNDLTTTPPPDGAQSVTNPAPAPAVLPLPPTAGLSPSRMYERAWGDYSAGQHESAISGFEQLIQNFPDVELSDDAQYLIGESLYLLNRFPEAAAAYNRVIERYATGDQVDMAYYKRGLALERTGDSEAARATWDELVKRYPDSQGASLASQSLVRLSRQAPAAAPGRP